MDKQINKYKLFLGLLQSFSSYTIKKILDYFENEQIFFEADNSIVENINLLTKKQFEEYEKLKLTYDYEEEVSKLRNLNVNVCFSDENIYPPRLLSLPDKPYMLQYIGELPKNNLPSVAIIGSRMCSEYGKRNAEYFGTELSKMGIQIISGVADGIDGIAQRAVVNNGYKSFGILGNGVDVYYPRNNTELYEQLKHNGGVISEFSLGTKPKPENFPRRNRIISGLSDIVLVIEAKEKSGTAITVSMALEQGKIVYALPGRIDDPLSAGCNRLIAEGAGMASSIQAIINEIDYLSSTNQFLVQNTFNKGFNTDNKNSDNINEQMTLDSKTKILENVINKIECPDNNIVKEIIEELSENRKTTDQLYERLCRKKYAINIADVMQILFELQLYDVIVDDFGYFSLK